MRAEDMPENGHGLSPRENIILTGLVGDFLSKFHIILEDHYYYTKYDLYYKRFNDFNELKDYILLKYYMINSQPKECLELLNELRNYILSYYYVNCNKPEKYIELFNTSNIDPSIDYYRAIKWAISGGHIEVVRHLLNNPRVDLSFGNNYSIKEAYSENRNREMVKLLSQDKRVRSKLVSRYLAGHRLEIDILNSL